MSENGTNIPDLEIFDGKHVRAECIDGAVFTGLADSFSPDWGYHIFGRDEGGIKVGDLHIFTSDIKKVECITPHGSAELETEQLYLRRFDPEDAEELYQYFGADEEMTRYTGWNPYATKEMAEQMIRNHLEHYDDPRYYAWALDWEGILVGTAGAYDYDSASDSIEVGISIRRSFWKHGFAAETLKKVVDYLSENEKIGCVKGWCAADNTGSRKAMEKAGMKLVRTETAGLKVNGGTYDKLYFERRRNQKDREDVDAE